MQDAAAGESRRRYFGFEWFTEMARDRGQAKRQHEAPAGSAPVENDLGWVKKIGWGVAGIYAVIFGGLITWYLPKELSQLRESVKQDSTIQIDDQLQPIRGQLADIQGQLRLLRASQYPSKTLKEIGSLDQKTFSASLPALQKVVEQSASKIKPDEQTLRVIAIRLRQTSDTSPDYWPTVLQFIQFASSAITVSADVPPAGPPYWTISDVRCPAGPVPCIVASHRKILLDGGDIPGSRFENCRIKFTQNPVKMRGVQFINCVFEMPVTDDPTPYLKDAARQLLASNFTSLSIPSS